MDAMDELPQGGAGGVPHRPDPDYAGDDYRTEGRPPTVRHGRRSEGWRFGNDAERGTGEESDAGEEHEVEQPGAEPDGREEGRPVGPFDEEEGDATTADPSRARRFHPDEEGRPED
ncbi:hypothetical protein ACFY00_19905 [Kitasatospora sp. NPDC001540]|uniref:hypothetical protein n=1 Tax=Kitasatospora sp. NPDC001540 TaxID=3364014 RepID=UPI00367B9CEA